MSVTVLPTATRMKFGLTLPFEMVMVFVSTGPADVGDVGESPLQATAITSATGNTMLQTRYFQVDTDALHRSPLVRRRSVTKVLTGPDRRFQRPLQLTRMDPG